MTWYVLKTLNALYHDRFVPKKDSFLADPDVRNMLYSLDALEQTSRHVRTTAEFNSLYEQCYMLRYNSCKIFLEEKNLEKPQSRYEVKDVETLMAIEAKMKNGDLDDLRRQIIAHDTSLREVSHMFFKNEKYLEGKNALVDALKTVLQVETFSNERDQQYIYKLECHNPQLIVLCENSNFLTKPEKPRRHGIELWYCGGRNIAKLEYADDRSLPIYYSADWDYDGLDIFLAVKAYLPNITLLTPTGAPDCIRKTEHRSLWKHREVPSLLSGLTRAHFTTAQAKMVEALIVADEWIVEESNDLLQMLSDTAGITITDLAFESGQSLPSPA